VSNAELRSSRTRQTPSSDPDQLSAVVSNPAITTWYFLMHCMLSPVPLVCLSVTRVDQSKTVEVTIVKFSPYGRVAPSLFAR